MAAFVGPLIQQAVAPLAQKIAEQVEELGRLRAELATAQERVKSLDASQDARQAAPAVEVAQESRPSTPQNRLPEASRTMHG